MLNAATTMDARLTGVKDIADILGGGIRAGSLVIIEGESGSGKSVLSQHLAHGALHFDDNAIAYYTSDGNFNDLIAQMDSMALYVLHEFVTDRLRIYPLSSLSAAGNGQESLELLVRYISELPPRFKLVIVDSITPFMAKMNPDAKIELLRTLKELCGKERSIVLTTNTHIFEKGILNRTYLMSDYYLRLRSDEMIIWSGQIENRVIKKLEVLKLRGAEQQGGEGVKFEIRPHVGIQILPFVRVVV